MPVLKPLLCMFIILTIAGCESLHYYTQALSGQIGILGKRQSIHRLIADPSTSPDLKKQLATIIGLRGFARDALSLPVKDNYLSFSDLNRPYALWNVYAAPEFSLVPKTWCHPIVGCVAYRGYFTKQDAENYAERLGKEGYDTFVGGVAAYSTLGWFDDPVLNTFIYRSNTKLAGLIFHELAHQLLYVKGDTTFSESFATTIEREGLRRWLGSEGNPQVFDGYMSDYRRHQEFIELVMAYRYRLESVYTEKLSITARRKAKASVFSELQKDYTHLKEQWNGYAGYDAWFGQRLNNAKIITVSTYHDLVPALSGLLQTSGNDLELFYRKCRDLAEKPQQERLKELQQYAIE